MTLGDFVRENRRKLRLSQGALAQAVGVRRQTIYNWEAGVYLPPSTKLRKLAKALSASLDEILKLRGLRDLERRGEELLATTGLSPALAMPAAQKWVVSAIPLLEKSVGVDPADIVSGKVRWSGKHCFVQTPGKSDLFAFLIPDGAMAPEYRKGDIVLAHSGRAPLSGDVAIIKARESAAACRRYEVRDSHVFLRPSNPKNLEQQITPGDIEWNYPVST